MSVRTHTIVTILAALLGSPGVLAEPAAQRLAGSYRYVGGNTEIQALERAIESSTRRMNFLIRSLARSRLREANLPASTLGIVVAADRITVARPGRPAVSAPTDGRPVEWVSAERYRFHVSHRMDGAVFFQRFEGMRSLSVSRYVLSADGRRLTIETTITASRLPAPLVFRTSYERM